MAKGGKITHTHISSSKPHRNEIPAATLLFFDNARLTCAIADIVRHLDHPEFKMADGKPEEHMISGME